MASDDLVRAVVREHLTPTEDQRKAISAIYEELKRCLGDSKCLQIGSYARFTAIRPPHDLDVLFVMGPWRGTMPDPAAALAGLQRTLKDAFRSPTSHRPEISLQTHSVNIALFEGTREIFSVDVVPALVDGMNEFGDDTYRVPEIIREGHRVRREIEVAAARGTRTIAWIRSDPRGYTTVASRLNDANEDFRRAVKFVKGWRRVSRMSQPSFALKSFHVEQILSDLFERGVVGSVSQAVSSFFELLPLMIEAPRIRDRADASVFVDEYVRRLTPSQREEIRRSGERFAASLRKVATKKDLEQLLGVGEDTAPEAGRTSAQHGRLASAAQRVPTPIVNPARPWRA